MTALADRATGYCVGCGKYTTGAYVAAINHWSDAVRCYDCCPAPGGGRALLVTEETPAGNPESMGEPGDHVNVGRVDTVLDPADRSVVDAYKIGKLDLGQVSISPDLADTCADLPAVSLDPGR